MNSPEIIKENSAETMAWLSSLWAVVPPWFEPQTEKYQGIRPRFFEPQALKQRDFAVVPVIDFWVPSESLFFDLLKTKSKSRLYATGFEINSDLFFSAPMKADSVEDLMAQYGGHCLVAPRDEHFMVLNTFLDYWILAGPRRLVEVASGGSIPEAFERFTQAVTTYDDWFEAGMPFSDYIVKVYKEHNNQIRQGYPKS